MYTLGIDIGSTTSKCAILKDGTELVATSLQRGGLGTGGPEEALSRLWRESGLSREDMERVIATGYGRNKFRGADGEVSELTASSASWASFRILDATFLIAAPYLLINSVIARSERSKNRAMIS